METTEEFNAVDFEQRLTNLKDTQDSIQAMSTWCLKHRPNHKRVVSSWLNVLKQVKVEHRLILFYLANDVIQHSKRKNFEFVDSWGTTLQRATTMVRDEKVKNKIIRIFNIWEQRGIYNDEFLADLHDLLSINPTKKQQPVESDDEQVTIVSTNIRNCVRLEKDTDRSFKVLTKTTPVDTENIHALKDRRHVEDVGHEIEEHMNKLEAYIKTLHTEIKARTILIAVLEQTDAFYHNQRGEVKVVANAYRNFGNRIKTMKRKVDELCQTLPSPIPSPDINAPSPSPDADFDLPDLGFDHSFLNKSNGFLGGRLPFDINDFKSESPKSEAQPIQVIGGSSSSSKGLTDFNIDEFFKSIMPAETSSSSSAYGSIGSGPPQPVPPVSDYNATMYSEAPMAYDNQQQQQQQQQHQSQQHNMSGQNDHYGNQNSYRPPPMPPSNNNNPYATSQQQPPPPTAINNNNYNSNRNAGAQPGIVFNQAYQQQQQQQHSSGYHQPPLPPRARYPPNNNNNNSNVSGAFNQPQQHMPLAPPPLPPAFDGNLSDEYNPETWDLDMSWNTTSSQDGSFQQQHSIDTPVSPPHFEREPLNTNVREFGDPNGSGASSSGKPTAVDVDHRRMMPAAGVTNLKDKGRGAVDIDHRNLISLTGSSTAMIKKNTTSPLLPVPSVGLLQTPLLPAPLQPPNMWRGDTDYRQTPMTVVQQQPTHQSQQSPHQPQHAQQPPHQAQQQPQQPPHQTQQQPPLPKDTVSFGKADVDYRVPPPKIAAKEPVQQQSPLLPPPPLEPPQLSKMNELLEIQKQLFDKGTTETPSTPTVPVPLASPPKIPAEFLSPPPTPSRQQQQKIIKSSPGLRRGQNGRGDNVEAIDMEMSDEDFELPDFTLPDLADAFEEEETDDTAAVASSVTSKENDVDRLADTTDIDANDNEDMLMADADDPPQKHGRPLHPPRPLFDNVNLFRTPPPFGNMQPFARPLLMTPNFRQNQSPNHHQQQQHQQQQQQQHQQNQHQGPRFWGGNNNSNQMAGKQQHSNQQQPPSTPPTKRPWERAARPNPFDLNTTNKTNSSRGSSSSSSSSSAGDAPDNVVVETTPSPMPATTTSPPAAQESPRVVINPFKQQQQPSSSTEIAATASVTADVATPATTSPAVQAVAAAVPTTPTPSTTPAPKPSATPTPMPSNTPTPTKRVNPFSQPPRFPITDVENNSPMASRGGGNGGAARGSWQQQINNIRPMFEQQQPDMMSMFSPGGGGVGGVARMQMSMGGVGPIFHHQQQQQGGGMNQMGGFQSPMMRGGRGGGRGGGPQGSPYFRQQGPSRGGMGGGGMGMGNNNQRPMFRNNFRGNPRGGGGMW